MTGSLDIDYTSLALPKKGKKPKKPRIKVSKLRAFARNQGCTLRVKGVCNSNPETTVLAHVKSQGHGTMGAKPHDLSAVHACSACHAWIDGEGARQGVTRDFIDALIFPALLETLNRVIDAGLVEVKR